MTTWFISDTHFYHSNIIKFCGRPYSSAEEMNEGLINNWNSRIGKKDVVYHLGDFAFCGTSKAVEILNRLNGKIHYIMGNHDKCIKDQALQRFESVSLMKEISINGQMIVLCHFPLESWHKSYKGSFHLHGHTHKDLDTSQGKRRIDVSVDTHNMFPVSYEEIYENLSKREITIF